MNRKLTLISMLTPLLAPAVAGAAGRDLVVGSCVASSYATVQAAVDAAVPGAHITLCPGTYAEQVVVPAGKGNLVIQGRGKGDAVIQYPAAGEGANGPDGADAVVALSPGAGDTYTLTGVTVQGPWHDTTNGRHIGVLVTGAGSTMLAGDAVRNIIDADPAGQANFDGFAVAFGDSNLFDDGTEIAGHGTLTGSTLSNYQMLGVTASVPGSSAMIANNQISGPPGGSPSDSLVGVVVGDGATARVTNNTVTGNSTPSADPANRMTQGTGIYLGFGPGAVTVANNTLSGNDLGLELDGAAGVSESNDRILSSTFDGVHVDASSPDGTPSTGNTLKNVRVSGSGGYDCADDTAGSGTAGTADVWSGAVGRTANRDGLCRSNGPRANAAWALRGFGVIRAVGHGPTRSTPRARVARGARVARAHRFRA